VKLPSKEVGDINVSVQQYKLANILSDVGGAYQSLLTIFIILFGVCFKRWVNRDFRKQIIKRCPEEPDVKHRVK
jgi:hypothetical protein